MPRCTDESCDLQHCKGCGGHTAGNQLLNGMCDDCEYQWNDADDHHNAIRSMSIFITPSLTVGSLFDLWRSGKKSEVLKTLASEHPAMTALFIVQGSHNGLLSVSDCNEVANTLIQQRQTICK